MEVLDKLFGSPARVKVMRFFLVNPVEVFVPSDVARVLRISKGKARSEINFLRSVGFLEKSVKETQIIFKTKKRPKKKREPGVKLNSLFPFLRPLHSLFVEAAPVSRELLVKRFKRLGKGLRFVALSGIFSGKAEGGIDILIVGDRLRRGTVEKILRKVESELGKELNYALLSTEEFKYREGMYDKFIVDILEGDHDKLIDNLNI